jgi:hypothetical protein
VAGAVVADGGGRSGAAVTRQMLLLPLQHPEWTPS